MPQMMPSFWLIILSKLILSLIIIMICLYFSSFFFPDPNKSYIKKIPITNNNNKNEWKWKW